MKKVKLKILKVGRAFATKKGVITHLSSKVMEFNEDTAKELIASGAAMLYDEKKEASNNDEKISELEAELEKVKEEDSKKLDEEIQKVKNESSKEIEESNKKISELEAELEKVKEELKAKNTESEEVTKTTTTKTKKTGE